MTLVNISNKIINLGSDPILPNETRPITKATAELPAIKAFAEKQLLQIIDDGKSSASASTNKKNAKSTPSAAENPASTPASLEGTGDNPEKVSVPSADDKKTVQTKKK